jgi:hypothetical protein
MVQALGLKSLALTNELACNAVQLITTVKMFVVQATRETMKLNCYDRAGNTKGGSITLPLTSCLTGLD